LCYYNSSQVIKLKIETFWRLLCTLLHAAILYKMRVFKRRIALYSIALALAIMLGTGCSSLSKTQRGAAIGAGAGSTVGVLIGRAAGNAALGAIIGGALGGTAGAYIGGKLDRQASQLKKSLPGATVTKTSEGIVINFASGILFNEDKSDLIPPAEANLNTLAASLQNNPQTKASIIGHTDSTGTAAGNMDLSTRRAESVKAYLVGAGVSSSRLTTLGKGATQPIATNSTAEGRAQNRRVEIIISDNNNQFKNQANQGGQ
jgi:outer membrane protein OmpA-like peptidoglycan-associated protein